MSDYHKYVFEGNKFVGDFETMYAREDVEGYDSWHQENHRNLRYSLSTAILNNYIFEKILDLGCGKGYYTNTLKRANNYVCGVDGSLSAISKAQTKFKDIDFVCSDISEYIDKNTKYFDVVISMEVLSYLKNWRDILDKISIQAKYLFITLYLPKSPAGYIKNFEDFKIAIAVNYEIKHEIFLANESCLLLFSESRFSKTGF